MRFRIPLFGFKDLEKQFKWSLILHLLIIVLSMVTLPNFAKKPLIIPPNIVVDLVAPSELTTAPNTVKEKPQPKPIIEPKKPKPAPKSEPPKTVEKQKMIKPKPVEKIEKKPEPVPTKKTAQKKEKQITKKEPPKESQTTQDDQFSSLLKNLVGEEDAQSPPSPDIDKPIDSSQKSGQAATVSDNLTLSQADALRYQLANCWNIPVGAMDAENLVVEILAIVGPDRVVQSTEILDKSRYNSDPFFRSAADSARRALLNPRCSPLALPEDKYDLWKNIRIRFNPKEMFGG